MALGSNLGDRFDNLQQALRALSRLAGVTTSRVSPVYESAAHTSDPTEEQPAYLNAVVEVRSTLSPNALLDACLKIEQSMGRTRHERWSPRVIDLDLITFGSYVIREAALQLPHPRLAERRFVLQPLVDLSPHLIIPAPHEASVYSLLNQTPDAGLVRRCERTLRLA